MIINYVEYKDLPSEITKRYREPWEHLETGALLLEIFDNRIKSRRNIRDIKDILANYFKVELKKLEPIKIHIGEFRTVFINFNLFKIKVYIDLD